MTAISGMGGFGALGTLLFGLLADRLGQRDMAAQPRLMALERTADRRLRQRRLPVARMAGCGDRAGAVRRPAWPASTADGRADADAGARAHARHLDVGAGGAAQPDRVGVGPTLAGLLSDFFASRFGADSVRWAMVVVLLACLPAVGLYWRAATTIRADIERAAHA